MNFTKKANFASPETQTAQNPKTKNIAKNSGENFQSALNRARNLQLEEKMKKIRDKKTVPSPAPSSSSPNTSAPTSGGFASSSSNSVGGFKNNMAVSGTGGFRDSQSNQNERVEQELNNQLIQSGLQAQVLKSNSSSGQDNS